MVKVCKVIYSLSRLKLHEGTSSLAESPNSSVCLFSRVHLTKYNEIYLQIRADFCNITTSGHPHGNTVCVIHVPAVLLPTLSPLLWHSHHSQCCAALY